MTRHAVGLLALPALGLALAAGACARPRAGSAAPAVGRPPAGADSAALAGWVAARRRACRGDFAALYDEGAVADSAGGGVRYRAFLAGVTCRSR